MDDDLTERQGSEITDRQIYLRGSFSPHHDVGADPG